MTRPSPDDAADAAFRRYFRAQLPTQWPASPVPADAAPARPLTRGGSWRTRLTLGASVAALLVFGLALSYGPGTNTREKKGNDLLPSSVAGPQPHGRGLGNHIPKNEPMEIP